MPFVSSEVETPIGLAPRRWASRLRSTRTGFGVGSILRDMPIEPVDPIIQHRALFGLVVDFVEQARIDFEPFVGRGDMVEKEASAYWGGEAVFSHVLAEQRQGGDRKGVVWGQRGSGRGDTRVSG